MSPKSIFKQQRHSLLQPCFRSHPIPLNYHWEQISKIRCNRVPRSQDIACKQSPKYSEAINSCNDNYCRRDIHRQYSCLLHVRCPLTHRYLSVVYPTVGVCRYMMYGRHWIMELTPSSVLVWHGPVCDHSWVLHNGFIVCTPHRKSITRALGQLFKHFFLSLFWFQWYDTCLFKKNVNRCDKL